MGFLSPTQLTSRHFFRPTFAGSGSIVTFSRNCFEFYPNLPCINFGLEAVRLSRYPYLGGTKKSKIWGVSCLGTYWEPSLQAR